MMMTHVGVEGTLYDNACIQYIHAMYHTRLNLLDLDHRRHFKLVTLHNHDNCIT